MSFAFRDVETQPRGAALTATALTVLVIGACGGQGGNVASRTPSPSSSPAPQASATGYPTPVPSPVRVTGAYGVLYGSQSASTYTITIIGVDGKIVAAAEASTPPWSRAGASSAPPSPHQSAQATPASISWTSRVSSASSPPTGRPDGPPRFQRL